MNDFPTIDAFQLGLLNNRPLKSKESSIDPYQLMLAKKDIDLSEIRQEWPIEDIQALEAFCRKNGILGFSGGKINPKAALSMLKRQVGDFSGVELEDRTTGGYKKIGTMEENSSKPKSLLLG